MELLAPAIFVSQVNSQKCGTLNMKMRWGDLKLLKRSTFFSRSLKLKDADANNISFTYKHISHADLF